MTLKNVGLAIGIISLSSGAFGQNSQITSAALEYQKASSALQYGKFDEAHAGLMTAKEFIDEAGEVATESSKNLDKMYLYRGQIYGGLIMTELALKGENADEELINGYISSSLEAYKDGYAIAKKYKRDIEEAVTRSAGLMGGSANMAYNEEMYADAGEAYELGANYFSTIGILDTAMLFNSALCYEKAGMFEEAADQYSKVAAVQYRGATSAAKAAYCYKQVKKFDEAKAIINKARETYPNDKDLLTQLVNISLDEGDNVGAKKALDDAIAADPDNASLHYIIGTIYMTMENDVEAEKSLRKALEIDPNNVNAQYQLGAHLYNWGQKLKDQASFLPVNDPKEEGLLKEAEEKIEGAIKYLEMYIEKEPNDKPVLDILSKAYHKQGNTAKALEYKKRSDAL